MYVLHSAVFLWDDTGAVGFLFTEFFLQIAGWCFLGLVFMLLYLLIRHFAAVWGVCVVSISFITAVGETFPEQSAIRYILSPYHALYLEKSI